MFQFFGRATLDLALPNACIACHDLLEFDSVPNLCAACVRSFWDPFWIHRPDSTLHFIGDYAGLLRRLIVRSKFFACPFSSLALVHLAIERMKDIETRYDLVCDPPTSALRLSRRRYAFTRDLAQHAARDLGLRYVPDLLTRTGEPARQLGLSRTQRLQNLRRSFCSNHDLEGKTVLVIDDVHTTGATTLALSKVLLRQGALRVDFLILARTPRWIEP